MTVHGSAADPHDFETSPFLSYGNAQVLLNVLVIVWQKTAIVMKSEWWAIASGR